MKKNLIKSNHDKKIKDFATQLHENFVFHQINQFIN